MKKTLFLVCMIMQNIYGADGLSIIQDATFFKIHYPEYSVIYKTSAYVTNDAHDSSRNDFFVKADLQRGSTCVSFHDRFGAIVYAGQVDTQGYTLVQLLRKRLDPKARFKPIKAVAGAYERVIDDALENVQKRTVSVYDEHGERIAKFYEEQGSEVSLEMIKQWLQAADVDVSQLNTFIDKSEEKQSGFWLKFLRNPWWLLLFS